MRTRITLLGITILLTAACNQPAHAESALSFGFEQTDTLAATRFGRIKVYPVYDDAPTGATANAGSTLLARPASKE